MSSHGYVKVRVGEGHPLADPNGYAYEHLLVWVSAGRDRPPKGKIIHHENEDRTDNRIGNLSLKCRGNHLLEEHGVTRDGKTGRFVGEADGVEAP